MKITLVMSLLLAFLGTALADYKLTDVSKWRLAQSSSQVCVSSCSTQSDSCKRACPQTFSTPCLNACDIQALTCIRNCQEK